MKKINIILISLSVIVLAASCSKSSSINSALVGKWKYVEYALDNNNNQKIDAGEVYSAASAEVSTVIFQPDGNYLSIFTHNGTLDTNIYPYHLDDKKITFTINGQPYVEYIDSMTSSYMRLKDANYRGVNGTVIWYMYSK